MRVRLDSSVHSNLVGTNQKNFKQSNVRLSHSKYIDLHSNENIYNPKNYWISFMGLPLNIIDGSNHATNMQHFMKALNPDAEINMIDVDVSPKDKNVKLMRSLYEKLHRFNYCTHHEQEYVAIPALASVSLLNLQDQYNRLMNSDVKFTP